MTSIRGLDTVERQGMFIHRLADLHICGDVNKSLEWRGHFPQITTGSMVNCKGWIICRVSRVDGIADYGIPLQMIDEVHTLIGAGAAEGAIDAANILKPALARGELQCIGATTLDEYRKHIEKDPALERYTSLAWHPTF